MLVLSLLIFSRNAQFDFVHWAAKIVTKWEKVRIPMHLRFSRFCEPIRKFVEEDVVITLKFLRIAMNKWIAASAKCERE